MRFFSLIFFLLASLLNVANAQNVIDTACISVEHDFELPISKSITSQEDQSYSVVSGLFSNEISPFIDFIEINEYKEFKTNTSNKSAFLSYKNHFSYSNHKTLKSFLYRFSNNSDIVPFVSKQILYHTFLI